MIHEKIPDKKTLKKFPKKFMKNLGNNPDKKAFKKFPKNSGKIQEKIRTNKT